MRPRKKIQRIWRRADHPFGVLWEWAKRPRSRRRRYRRWTALAHWANAKRKQAPANSQQRKEWARHGDTYEAKARANEPKPSPRRVIGRSTWGAAAARGKSSMTSTANGVFVHHTVAGAPGLRRRERDCCTELEEKLSPSAQAAVAVRIAYGATVLRPLVRAGLESAERAEMRNLQAIAFSRGFDDVSYSFVVMPSGRVYEGRGLNVAGAHTIGFNSTAYGCAAAGNYETSKPTEAMVAAFRWLRRDYLDLEQRPLRPHGAVSQTACPGQHLRARLGDL